MPLMNTHASVAKARYSMQSCKKTQIKHSSENRVGFYLIILFSKNIFRYAICFDSFKIPYFVAPDLGPFV